jgi:DNA-binding PucR family transcriptional regulator
LTLTPNGRLRNSQRTSTLGVYLEENCSRSRAAKRLGLHENTITYRIRRTQEVLGRPIESDSLRLSAALALMPVVIEPR